MTDVKALLGELRTSDPKFDEAQSVVDLVRSCGDMLERMRERKNWSQFELAERLGVTTGRVSQLESGTLRNAPSLKTMARFAHACGETVTLVASGEAVPYVRSDANVNIDLNVIMQELTALRAEVQALRAAVRPPEPRPTGAGALHFPPGAQAALAVPATKVLARPYAPLMAAQDGPTQSLKPPLAANPAPVRAPKLSRVARRETPEAEE